jgi:hypothetical protein
VFWRTTERFVPRSEIKSVVVHEALRTWNVVYYLGIVRDSDVVVAFEVSWNAVHISEQQLTDTQDVRPRLDVLVSVYHHVQDQLFPTPTRSQTVTC